MSIEKPKTVKDWQNLPWLLSAKQVMDITGIGEQELRVLRETGALHQHRARRGLYFRVEVARLCKVET